MRRTDTHLKIKAALALSARMTTKEIAQTLGIAEEGASACLRGMVRRREVRVVDPSLRDAPFVYALVEQRRLPEDQRCTPSTHGSTVMAKQINAHKMGQVVHDPNDGDERSEAAANKAQKALINADRPSYTQGSAAKPGAADTKVTTGGKGAAFNPCRS